MFEVILGVIVIDFNWNLDEFEILVNFMLNMDYFLLYGFIEDDDYVGLV